MALSMSCVKDNVYEVGAFDAKTYFAELLRKVQEGCIINITKNGKNVAVMQNKQNISNSKSLMAWEDLLSVRNDIRKNGTSLTLEEIMEYKEDGRK